jgi:transposase-like protein
MSKPKLSALQRYLLDYYKKEWDRPQLTFKQLMRTMYVVQKKSMAVIAKDLGISPNTVQRWLKQEGISSRKMRWL